VRSTRGEANRRVAEAADLGPRRAITGEPLPPLLTGTAAAQRNGHIGAGHVRVLRDFVHGLPCSVDVGTREKDFDASWSASSQVGHLGRPPRNLSTENHL
jgi:hypothetical protein